MIEVKTFETDDNSDTEIATRVNNIVGGNRIISLEQTDGYKWKVVYETNTTPQPIPSVEEVVEHVAEVCDSVEFMRGVPVKLPSETKALLRGRIRKALTARDAALKEAMGECAMCKDKGVIELVEQERAEIKNAINQVIDGAPGRIFVLPFNVEKVVGYIHEPGLGDVAYKAQGIDLKTLLNEAIALTPPAGNQ